MGFESSEADRLLQRAVATPNFGSVPEAVRLLQAALALDPDHILVLTALAEAALMRRDPATALQRLDRALAIEPNCAPAWNHRAMACWLDGRPADAMDAARRAVAIQPPNPKFRMQLAQLAAWTGHGGECRAALAPLLADRDHDREAASLATGVLGELAIAEGRFEEADDLLARTLAELPHLPATRMMLGMNQLRRGLFEEGWANYAARESVAFLYPDGAPAWPGAVWQGQDLTGKALLVTDDQGRGDAIQFFRYLQMLRARGVAHVTWLTFPELVRLLASSAPGITVLDVLPQGSAFDFNCSSSVLPRWLGTTLETVPAPRAYIAAPAALKSPVKPPSGRRPRVGFAWSGDPRHTRDHLRSIQAARFLRLADVRGISAYSLQPEVRPADKAALLARPRIGRQIEHATDFLDTAAFVAKLDLIVTVDTAVAHLAAAMGKPVWVIIHVAPDWRWLTEREDSPWYPGIRLFRVRQAEWNPANGGWDPVLDRVAAALKAFAAGG